MRVDWLELSNRLFNASLNGWYQGIIITGVVALILKWTRGNAATRHALWFMTLWVVALLIPVHMLVKTPDSDSATGTFANAAIDPGDVPAPKHPALSEPQEGTFPEEDLYGIDPGEEPSSPAPAIERQLMTDPDPLARATPPPTDTLGAKLWRLAKRVSAVLAKPVSVQLGPGTGWWPWIPAAVMAGWIIMAVVQLAALACRLCQIRRGKQAGFAPGPELKGFFERIASEVRPGRDVELKITADQHSPMLLGFLHPVVLLPAGLPAREADPILRHELAHAKRRDDWANLVQNLIRAVLPLHPAVWWIGRQLSLEREIACDDVVLGQGGPAKAYALLLTELAGRLRTSVPLLAAGASNNKTQLQQRIDMILNPNRSISSRLVKARLG